MNDFFSKIAAKWSSLPPKQKQSVVLAGLVVVIVIIALTWHQTRTKPPAAAPNQPKAKNESILLDPDVFKKTELTESRRKLLELEQQLAELKKAQQPGATPQGNTPGNTSAPDSPPEVLLLGEKVPPSLKEKQQAQRAASQPPIPPLPPPPPPPTADVAKPPAPPPPPEVFGDIVIEANKFQPPKPEDKGKKKEKQKVFLPPSFMEATLLSGLYAKTSSAGTGGSTAGIPVLLRIRDIAVLPNKVKANLKGCFLIAEGYGDLSDERAHMRLVSLTCLDRKGNSVIDQKIKGFIVDTDGKIGLKGRVVSKMGTAIARSVLAGFVAGFGDAIKMQAQTINSSALGTQTTLDPSKAAQAGAGSAISKGMDELTKFYLDLAKQTVPVIEVGATKNVTIVTTEGQDLEIKEVCLDAKCKGDDI